MAIALLLFHFASMITCLIVGYFFSRCYYRKPFKCSCPVCQTELVIDKDRQVTNYLETQAADTELYDDRSYPDDADYADHWWMRGEQPPGYK